jgi:putative endonuclease
VDWFVYIIECKDGKLYTGITNDLKRRLQQHNYGKGCRFTRARFPVKLLHNETYPSREAALKREAEIKRWTRDRKLTLLS